MKDDGPVTSGFDGAAPADNRALAALLNTEYGRKYRLGGVVASGGMGAIIDAHDVNIRRSVAMKVLLDPKQARHEDVLRFVEEAQLTGQLEHPGIVPVHELGVDTAGNVFYTMKFVRGRTLADVLADVAGNEAGAAAAYPLNRLLNVFSRVCDAMAFAHSRGVLHRDLKPANVMLGEYGEVLVLDWGLAKVRAAPCAASSAGNPAATPEPLAFAGRPPTMAGEILGTPAFMAPEQALGLAEEQDDRTDVYALGAILYSILTLRPPVREGTVAETLAAVAAGRVEHPGSFNRLARSKYGRLTGQLGHCPRRQIPDALSAVAMKALARRPADRYATVKDLQRDVDAYLNGFATSAEHAGLSRLFALFVRRHRAVSTAIGLALCVLAAVGATSYVRILREKDRAEDALERLRATAPDLVQSAQRLVDGGRFEDALMRLDAAISLQPGDAATHVLRGNVLQTLLRPGDAGQSYARALRLDPANAAALTNAAVCRVLAEQAAPSGRIPDTAILALHAEQCRQQRYAEARFTLRRVTGLESLQAYYERQLVDRGLPPGSLRVFGDGTLRIALSDVHDLSPLRGLPLSWLWLQYVTPCRLTNLSPLTGMPLRELTVMNYHCRPPARTLDLSPLRALPLERLTLPCLNITDLSPLRGLRLVHLNLAANPVQDLAPLAGMPLRELRLYDRRFRKGTPPILIRDLSPLRGLPIETLNLTGLPAEDLAALAGMPLRSLDVTLRGRPVYNSQVHDLSPLRGAPLAQLRIGIGGRLDSLEPLRGMPLRELDLSEARVADLSPLRGLPLESLAFAVTKPPPAGIDALRGMASLLTINGVTAAEFWRRYETGEIPTLKAAATNAAADAAAEAFPTNLPTSGPGAPADAGL